MSDEPDTWAIGLSPCWLFYSFVVMSSFKHGPQVDPSGELPDGRRFSGIDEFKRLAAISAVLDQTEASGGGIRTLIHELVQSPLFHTR